jgi:hypothetical protein
MIGIFQNYSKFSGIGVYGWDGVQRKSLYFWQAVKSNVPILIYKSI